jgi:hypothetical protein
VIVLVAVCPAGTETDCVEPGEMEKSGADPLSNTIRRLPVALSTTEMVALRDPIPVVVNVTPSWHDVPIGTPIPHELLSSAKSPAFVPEIVVEEMFKAATPEFVS